MGLRYHTKHAEIWRFGLVRIIHARLVGYLSPTNLDQFIVCCVETVFPTHYNQYACCLVIFSNSGNHIRWHFSYRKVKKAQRILLSASEQLKSFSTWGGIYMPYSDYITRYVISYIEPGWNAPKLLMKWDFKSKKVWTCMRRNISERLWIKSLIFTNHWS